LGVHLPYDIDDKKHGTDVPSVYTAETQVARQCDGGCLDSSLLETPSTILHPYWSWEEIEKRDHV
jgi:hypothetical protein